MSVFVKKYLEERKKELSLDSSSGLGERRGINIRSQRQQNPIQPIDWAFSVSQYFGNILPLLDNL